MKKSILTLGLILGVAGATSVYANDAEILKQQDVRACEAQTQNANPTGEAKQKPCECAIENTDYEALAEAKKKGDLANIQEIKQEAEEACAEDA